MKKENSIVEKNRVIAEFMGAEFKYYEVYSLSNSVIELMNPYYWRCSVIPNNDFSWIFPGDLDYDNDIYEQYKVMIEIKNIWLNLINNDDGKVGILYVECHNAWSDLNQLRIFDAIYEFAKYWNEVKVISDGKK